MLIIDCFFLSITVFSNRCQNWVTVATELVIQAAGLNILLSCFDNFMDNLQLQRSAARRPLARTVLLIVLRVIRGGES